MAPQLSKAEFSIRDRFHSLEDGVENVTPKENQLYDSYVQVAKQVTQVSEYSSSSWLKLYSEIPLAAIVNSINAQGMVNSTTLESEWSGRFDQYFADTVITESEMTEIESALQGQMQDLEIWLTNLKTASLRFKETLANTTFKKLDGTSFETGSLPPKSPFVLSYFFKDCAPCMIEIKHSIEFARKNPEFVAVFANINSKDTSEMIQTKLSKMGYAPEDIPPNVIFIHDSGTYRSLMPRGIMVAPLSLIIEHPNGNIVNSFVGYNESLFDFFE